MADNNFITVLAFFLATVFIFSISPTGNYVSNYNPASNPSPGDCSVNGKMDCYYEPSSGWWTTVCVNGRWVRQDFCGELEKVGDKSCIFKRASYRDTITVCRNPNLPEENVDYGTTRGSIVYTP